MRLAVSYWPDCRWVFPIDADEFLVAADGLAVLDHVAPQVDALVICKVNHGLDAAPVESTSTARASLASMPLRCHLGTYPPKVALRPNLDRVISQGNHQIVAEDVEYVPGLALGLHYREFQICSVEQLKRRITNGGQRLLAAQRYTG
jgi:hypothetical protein